MDASARFYVADEALPSGSQHWPVRVLALFGPKATPKAVIAKLNAAIVDALADPAVRTRLADLGQEIPPRRQQTPDALGAFHKAAIDKWWPIIRLQASKQSDGSEGASDGDMNRRALIVGGSLGGLFAANLLRSIGWDVAVFERAHGDLSGRGARLGTHEGLFAVLRGMGIVLDDLIGVPVRLRIALDANGSAACEVPVRTVARAWDRIYRVLKQALPTECYFGGRQLLGFQQDADRVSAAFADGSHAEGDLLVGADGMRSTVSRSALTAARTKLRRLCSLAGRSDGR